MIDATEARERVVEAADRLFYARGVQAVGMDAVRAEAGVSLKRIYALFPSKDDLVVAVLHGRRAQWNAGIAASAADAASARDRILAIFDFLDAWFRRPDFHGCAFINVFGELSGGAPGVARVVREQKEAFGEYVAQLVRDAGAPDSLAPQIAILAEGAQTTAAIGDDPEAAAQARAAAATLIDAALAA
ncbi:TetR/AcrR family transcriptional regulator [Glycomyces sp. A-F 0318]|uniref:TetR/AcrR family transcriptional regulator n=1 Tax=Glycomyces amatae TaxID=2881355 RepID=UPI001E399CFA|nr:TetR/AcrR family transcriptional regulator [Glycomyces amatae]MCD0445439.1 TetR/AcrR family transcriptional regulator [Glycomyces amatae]